MLTRDGANTIVLSASGGEREWERCSAPCRERCPVIAIKRVWQARALWFVAPSAYRPVGMGVVGIASIAGRRGYAVARCMAALLGTVDTYLGKRGFVHG